MRSNDPLKNECDWIYLLFDIFNQVHFLVEIIAAGSAE